ncbi:unnamed protein product [Calicophoron daubneyi]|uniref:Uncharacterized protein n=1 Tax=Calicophoron daubneyi TaxID=300641 RepID=A0AAV2T2R2_CALDB
MTSTHSNKLPKDLLRYQLRGHNRKTVSRSRALRGEESEGSLTTDDDARNSGTDSEASLPASQMSECTSSANSGERGSFTFVLQVVHFAVTLQCIYLWVKQTGKPIFWYHLLLKLKARTKARTNEFPNVE